MNKLLLALVVTVLNTTVFAQHSLEKIWQTDSTFKSPESILYDVKSKILFVSNIGDFQKQGVGSISKVGLDGKVIQHDWVTGLTATKGLGLYNNRLYAAEQTSVAVIDVNTASLVQRISIEGAQLMNDITVDAKGIVYVSDTRTGIIHKIENGKASVYLENLKSANGLLAVGSDLYILSDGRLLKADAGKKLTTLVEGMEGGTDGIIKLSGHEFIITCFQGVIYSVKDDGSKQVLLDTRGAKISAADPGYDPATKTIYVPTLGKNYVIAYKLK